MTTATSGGITAGIQANIDASKIGGTSVVRIFAYRVGYDPDFDGGVNGFRLARLFSLPSS